MGNRKYVSVAEKRTPVRILNFHAYEFDHLAVKSYELTCKKHPVRS